jgi:DNA-directed RNA polymerase subunit RPC12/RpoP
MAIRTHPPLGYRCIACDGDLPRPEDADAADASVVTCPGCGTACDLEGTMRRSDNVRPAKKVVPTGTRAVMHPFL